MIQHYYTFHNETSFKQGIILQVPYNETYKQGVIYKSENGTSFKLGMILQVSYNETSLQGMIIHLRMKYLSN